MCAFGRQLFYSLVCKRFYVSEELINFFINRINENIITKIMTKINCFCRITSFEGVSGFRGIASITSRSESQARVAACLVRHCTVHVKSHLFSIASLSLFWFLSFKGLCIFQVLRSGYEKRAFWSLHFQHPFYLLPCWGSARFSACCSTSFPGPFPLSPVEL